MKRYVAILLTALMPLGAALAQESNPSAGPAEKTDGGSLSSGAKDAMPGATGSSEDAPMGSGSSGASTGTEGSGSSESGAEIPSTPKGSGATEDVTPNDPAN